MPGGGESSALYLKLVFSDLRDQVQRLIDDPGETGLPEPVCARDAERPDPPEEAVEGLLPKHEPGFIYGEDETMKTTAALAIGCSVAGGYKVFGRFNE